MIITLLQAIRLAGVNFDIILRCRTNPESQYFPTAIYQIRRARDAKQ